MFDRLVEPLLLLFGQLTANTTLKIAVQQAIQHRLIPFGEELRLGRCTGSYICHAYLTRIPDLFLTLLTLDTSQVE